MIEKIIAIEYLTLLISILGILIGFLLIFLQYVPERKRRILDIILAKKIDLATENLLIQKDEENFISLVQKSINNKNIKIKILNKKITMSSIIFVNLLIFCYTILLFLIGLLYLLKIYVSDEISIDEMGIIILTCFALVDYMLLIFMVYISCVKDYEIKTN